MSVILALDISLAVLVLAVAVWTIVSREAFAAVVGYVAYGLLVSLVWVRLFAVDVALTEAAIGSGVTGVLLISAAVRLRGTEAAVAAEWPGAGSRLLAAALCIVVTAALAAVVLMMPDPGATLAPEAARHLAATELGNPVTARPDGLPRARHPAREGRAVPGRHRRVVAGGRRQLGRHRRPAARDASPGRAGLPRPVAAAGRHRGRHPYRLGRRQRAGRRVPGRRHPRRHVADRHHGAPCRSAGDRRTPAAPRPGRRAGGVPCRRPGGLCRGRRLPRLSCRPRQAADRVHRGLHDALHRGVAAHARPGAAGPAPDWPSS